MRSAEYTADSKPTDTPARMTVAAPVLEEAATSFTGRLPTSVKKPVNIWIAAARRIPITTAPNARVRGLTVISALKAGSRPERAEKVLGK